MHTTHNFIILFTKQSVIPLGKETLETTSAGKGNDGDEWFLTTVPSEGWYLFVPLLSGMALGLLCPNGALTGTVGILSVN